MIFIQQTFCLLADTIASTWYFVWGNITWC